MHSCSKELVYTHTHTHVGDGSGGVGVHKRRAQVYLETLKAKNIEAIDAGAYLGCIIHLDRLVDPFHLRVGRAEGRGT